ncbi:MAG: cellulase family glycosylhydrolase [Clostridia bacterium]|nr:cellulase family glycosylhydrolase [Clostridia bacterium]
MERIFTKGERFVDESGRQRIFNGINLCDKGYANEEKTDKVYELDFDENLIVNLKKRGVNLVRLGLTWDGVEPEAGKYDEDYLDRVQKVADLCEKHGIYFYLDMHQDLYGGAADTPADGAPMWACMTDGHEFKPTKFVWAEGYFWGKAIHSCFDHFWANDVCCGKPVQEHFCEMWKHVAERFKDNTALFGFDILNEPFPGSSGGKVFRKLIGSVVRAGMFDRRVNRIRLVKDALKAETRHSVLDQFEDPEFFSTIVTRAGGKIIEDFDKNYYSPFINRVAEAIREVTDKGIIIMENCYYSNTSIPCSTPAVTVKGAREPQLCFAPHGYDLMVDTPDYKYASNSRTGAIFDEHLRTQKRLNVPVIVGEWGGSGGNEDKTWLNHINFLLDKFDSNQWGQTYWCYTPDIFDTVVMESLVRTVPVAVSGTIDSYKTDRGTGSFVLKYTQGYDFREPTEIFVHKKPARVEADGEYTLEPVEDGESFILKVKTGTGKHKVVISF